MALVEALRPLIEGAHRPPGLPFVRLVEDGSDHLPTLTQVFQPNRFRPSLDLILYTYGPAITVPAGRVSQGDLAPLRTWDL